MLNVVKKIKQIYTNITIGAAAIICVFLVLLNVYNVIIRYFTVASFPYTEDITVLGMLWMMSLGLGVCWIYREHLTMNIIDSILKGKAMEILNFAIDVVGVAAGALMTYVAELARVVNTGFVQSALGFDESIRYIPIMAGGILLIFACIVNIVEKIIDWRGGEKT